VARSLRVSILQHSRQGAVHLELLDPLVADRLADALFLCSAQAAPTAGFLTPHTGLESVCVILTAQAQGGVHSGLTQTRLFNEFHHANTLAVHADDLLVAFVQHFSRLLTNIFFLHLLFTQTNSISSFINLTWSNWSAR
jgi:predicted hotdog family 3-hydroxylacyl-ACP dehydratase